EGWELFKGQNVIVAAVRSQRLVFFRTGLLASERAPISAQLAAPFAPRFAPHVLNGANAADQKPEHPAQTRLIECAADTPRCGAECNRPWHVEEKRAADAPQISA